MREYICTMVVGQWSSERVSQGERASSQDLPCTLWEEQATDAGVWGLFYHPWWRMALREDHCIDHTACSWKPILTFSWKTRGCVTMMFGINVSSQCLWAIIHHLVWSFVLDAPPESAQDYTSNRLSQSPAMGMHLRLVLQDNILGQEILKHRNAILHHGICQSILAMTNPVLVHVHPWECHNNHAWSSVHAWLQYKVLLHAQNFCSRLLCLPE